MGADSRYRCGSRRRAPACRWTGIGQTITSKRQQAEAIMAQVDSMNADLEQTVEAWNYANIKLGKIDSELASNAKHLSAAKRSLVVAQARIAKRLRDLYINGQGDSTLR
jgi:peptidoglycan hydrolase CwlO-like protein